MENVQELVVDRMYNVTGTIDDKMAVEFLEWCLAIEEFDAEYKNQFPEAELQPVTINIYSPGGVCSALDSMLDAMELIEAPIVTRAFGFVASCAVWLYIRGNLRMAGTNAQFMVHQCLYAMDGSLHDHEDMLLNSKKMQTRYDAMLYERTQLTKEILDVHRKEDWYFGKEEAIAYGLVNYDGKMNIIY